MNMFWMFHISLIVLRWDNPCAPVTFNKLLNYYEMNISGHSSLEFLMEMRWWQFFKVGCQTIPWGGGRQFFEGVADNSSRVGDRKYVQWIDFNSLGGHDNKCFQWINFNFLFTGLLLWVISLSWSKTAKKLKWIDLT